MCSAGSRWAPGPAYACRRADLQSSACGCWLARMGRCRPQRRQEEPRRVGAGARVTVALQRRRRRVAAAHMQARCVPYSLMGTWIFPLDSSCRASSKITEGRAGGEAGRLPCAETRYHAVKSARGIPWRCCWRGRSRHGKPCTPAQTHSWPSWRSQAQNSTPPSAGRWMAPPPPARTESSPAARAGAAAAPAWPPGTARPNRRRSEASPFV